MGFEQFVVLDLFCCAGLCRTVTHELTLTKSSSEHKAKMNPKQRRLDKFNGRPLHETDAATGAISGPGRPSRHRLVRPRGALTQDRAAYDLEFPDLMLALGLLVVVCLLPVARAAAPDTTSVRAHIENLVTARSLSWPQVCSVRGAAPSSCGVGQGPSRAAFVRVGDDGGNRCVWTAGHSISRAHSSGTRTRGPTSPLT